MENNLELYDKVRAVPENALKPIKGGRLSGMSDINPMWRIKALTATFGPCGFGWYYEIRDQRIVDGANGERAAFVDVALYVRLGEEWSRPIPGVGGSSFVTKEKAGLYVSDECFKMALTDALSVACKALGVGADVYFEKDTTKYSEKHADTQASAPASGLAFPGAEMRKAVTDYLMIDDAYRKQLFIYYNCGSLDDFSDSDIISIHAKLKEFGKL